MDAVELGEILEVALVEDESGDAEVEIHKVPVAAIELDDRVGVHPPDDSQAVGPHPFVLQRLKDGLARLVGADRTDIGRLHTTPASGHGDVQAVSSGEPQAQRLVDVGYVVADRRHAAQWWTSVVFIRICARVPREDSHARMRNASRNRPGRTNQAGPLRARRGWGSAPA